ncbi:peptidase PmbA [Tsuneonella dongtanensis]|uniref:Peptidase PmbA n=1 Tax=Tsuneonella dongtanensis TaxID=692370 RepID=A0A1B2A992_9SPHN|nr:TldD/PmbA family protein [Tsuneonella dongtanensis]ANY18743.1 peptidase PmbA [Tsuneonella dongtanensis]
MNSQHLLDAAEALVAAARRHGADAADAVGRGALSRGVGVRLGKLEDVDSSESLEVGLRAFVGRRSASVSSADLSRAGIEELAERAVAMARLAPEDPFAGLAPARALAGGPFADLSIADEADPSPEDLRARALEVEDAARAVSGVTNSEGGSASATRAAAALVTSEGFAGSYTGSAYSLSAVVIAGEGEGMQRDYEARSARHLADLPDPQEIGRLAGERTVARLAPGSLSSGPMSVVFDRRVSASLVGHLLGAMGAPAVARKSSFLAGREGEAIFAPGIRVVEDPLRLRGLHSRPFDGEGLACRPRVLVENGMVTGWLTNVASAAQLGLPLTGHATRGGAGAPGVGATNVDLVAGDESLAELIADIEDGVLVDYLIGQGVNPVTGDYSRGAAGRRIVKGKVEGPVAGFTIAGNLLEMFANMRAASDLETHRAVNAPSLRIDGMTVAGG